MQQHCIWRDIYLTISWQIAAFQPKCAGVYIKVKSPWLRRLLERIFSLLQDRPSRIWACLCELPEWYVLARRTRYVRKIVLSRLQVGHNIRCPRVPMREELGSSLRLTGDISNKRSERKRRCLVKCSKCWILPRSSYMFGGIADKQ